jgi:cation diffusion facilitator family transporter
MHSHSLTPWQHDHVYLGRSHERHERRTWIVVALTAAMMGLEIVGGQVYGSMALIADGWHMATHAGALAIAACAYRFARRHADDPRFSFGTGKFGELAGYSSAIVLGIIALLIAYESAGRLFVPVVIRFEEAIAIAVLGLMVNLATAWLLYDADHHHHVHEHDEDEIGAEEAHHHAGDDGHHHRHGAADHGGDDRDHNLRAAYFHVLADALTSVLAIIALLAGRLFGWTFMDPMMGLVGAAVIAVWSIGLMRSAGAVLVDMVPGRRLAREVRQRLETEGDRVADLHLWRLGPGHTALIAAVVSDHPQAPDVYRGRLQGIKGLSHVTVEVHICSGYVCSGQAAASAA